MQNEPQLSAVEEMAIKYNIPLADLESLLATALEEQRAKHELFIKHLLFDNGGSLLLKNYIKFNPDDYQITRREVIGEFNEVIALEDILNGKEA